VHFSNEPVSAGDMVVCEILKSFSSAVDLYRFFHDIGMYNKNVAKI